MRRNAMNAEQNPRPPTAWFSRMFSRIAAGYPRRANENMEKYRAEISRITAGIWWNFPAATREQLIKKYDKIDVSTRTLNPKRKLSIPEQHQLRIARKTLQYSDIGAKIMGGPTKAEAVEIITRLTGRIPKLNPTTKGLPCPNCQTLTPVSRANVYIKCNSCGLPLRSVRIRK